MGRPKKPKTVDAFQVAMEEIRSNPDLSPEDRKRLLSGEAAHSMYFAETGQERNPGQIESASKGFYSQAELYNPYFIKAWDHYKKEKLVKKEKIKLLTEQPGLSAQTRGQSALSLAGGASIPALSPSSSTSVSSKAKY